jgi:hypothetical protein
MIKYNTRTGLGSAMDAKARMKRDGYYKPFLSGMKCKKCRVDTVIGFTQHTGFAGSGSLDPVYDCCCPEFEQEIKARLANAAR